LTRIGIEILNIPFGRFNKTTIIHCDKLPNCVQCKKPIKNEEKIYLCQENKNFYHYDCFDIDHFKIFDKGRHNDILGIIKEDLKG
jgi:CRISPR/Cas system CMR-associated protein Cmr1 (group 7 of RAMP superfamily)